MKHKLIHKKNVTYFIASLVLIGLAVTILIIYFSHHPDANSAEYTSSIQNIIKDIKTSISSSSTPIALVTSTITGVFNQVDKGNPNLNYTEGLYLQIKDSCGVHYGGTCVRARACPALNCPVVLALRDDIVLKTDGTTTEADGITWYHAYFDEWVRYPDRMSQDLYIASAYVNLINSYKATYKTGEKVTNTTGKKIVINLTEQKLYAYEPDGSLFTEVSISTGLDDLPTPAGTFHIYDKTPSRYMQGPLPGISDQQYDLPGVPWTMYFTYQGAAVHGAYWHDNFGEQYSHGCVNLRPEDAERLYQWTPLGTEVQVIH